MRLGMPLALVLLAPVASVVGACSTDGLVFNRVEVPPEEPVEDCGNAADDDGDGQLDCADADCAGYRCVQPAPAGWMGPFALYDGDPATAPACAPPYSVLVLNAHADLQRESAICSTCSCSPPPDAACVPGSLTLYSAANCSGSSSTYAPTGDGSVCQSGGVASVGSIRASGVNVTGTCTPVAPQTPTIAPPTWGRAAVGCAAPPSPESGCGAEEVCMPPQSSPFSEMCIAHPGVVECTGSSYRSRRVYHAGVEDSRWCTPCGCSISGSCSGTLQGFADSACTNGALAGSFETSCINGPATHFVWSVEPVQDAECTVSGGVALGCIRPTDPITVCCEGEEPSCPSDMVEVPRVDGGSYCVDATEVTKRMYEQFLAASPSAANQPAGCEWNSTYGPPGPGPGGPDLPATYVDWCDAHAYCAWAGKRLCGAIEGGSLPFDEAAQSNQSQWYMACSRGGELDFPYGDYSDSTACRVGSIISQEPVAFRPCCEGGYGGISIWSGMRPSGRTPVLVAVRPIIASHGAAFSIVITMDAHTMSHFQRL